MRVERYSQFISGAFQHAGRYHGVLQCWGDAYKQCASPTHVLQLDGWTLNIEHKAEAIWRLQPKWIMLAGYSAGGWAVVQLAWKLQERGMTVDVGLLCDAVYMPLGGAKIAAPLALLRVWEIDLPKNITVLRSWRQQHSRPMGHKLVVPETVDWENSNIKTIRHEHLDDLTEFRKACVDYASGRAA